jgi:hypothetical protein
MDTQTAQQIDFMSESLESLIQQKDAQVARLHANCVFLRGGFSPPTGRGA